MLKVETFDVTLNRSDLRYLIQEIDPGLTHKHNQLRLKLQSLLQMMIDFPILEKTLVSFDTYELNILHNGTFQ
jgi:hypothetical protein